MKATCKPAIAWEGAASIIRVGSSWLSISDKQQTCPPVRVNAAELEGFPSLLQVLFDRYERSEVTQLCDALDGSEIAFRWPSGRSSRRIGEKTISVSRGNGWIECDASHLHELLLWLAFIDWNCDAAEIPVELVDVATVAPVLRLLDADGRWYNLRIEDGQRGELQKLLIQAAATPHASGSRTRSAALKFKTADGVLLISQSSPTEVSLMVKTRLSVATGRRGLGPLITHKLPRRALAELAVILSGQRGVSNIPSSVR